MASCLNTPGWYERTRAFTSTSQPKSDALACVHIRLYSTPRSDQRQHHDQTTTMLCVLAFRVVTVQRLNKSYGIAGILSCASANPMSVTSLGRQDHSK